MTRLKSRILLLQNLHYGECGLWVLSILYTLRYNWSLYILYIYSTEFLLIINIRNSQIAPPNTATDYSLQFCGWLRTTPIFKRTTPYQSAHSSSIKFNHLWFNSASKVLSKRLIEILSMQINKNIFLDKYEKSPYN